MTKQERIDQLFREVNKYVDENTFKNFEGEMIRGAYFEIHPGTDESCFQMKVSESILSSVSDVKSGRCYDLIVVLKDMGPYDDSEEASIERARRKYREEKKSEEIKSKVKAIKDEPEDE